MRRLFPTAVAALLLSGLPLLISPTSAQEVEVDPQADKVLKSMVDFLGQQKSTSVDMALQMEAKGIELPESPEQAVKVRYEQPNKFALITEQPSGKMMVISNGTQMWTYVDTLQKYSVEDAPATLQESDNPVVASFQQGPTVVAIPLGNLRELLLREVTQVKHDGTEQIDGTSHHKILFEQPGFRWTLWVPEGAKPLPAKAVIDMSEAIQQQLGPDARLEMLVTYRDWKLNYQPEAETFAFDPPPTAEEVDSLFEMSVEANPAEELVGQPAPEFQLELLDGGKVELAQHKDKDIVILDFWATWCGPCVEALPTISKVAKQFEDKGVKFYAVNVQEDAETVREFLTEQELKIPVALDTDAEVTLKYLAQAIPQTVLIGKDGRVQVVHIGASENLEEELTKELTALIEGKDLAEEELKRRAEAEQSENEEESPVEP